MGRNTNKVKKKTKKRKLSVSPNSEVTMNKLPKQQEHVLESNSDSDTYASDTDQSGILSDTCLPAQYQITNQLSSSQIPSSNHPNFQDASSVIPLNAKKLFMTSQDNNVKLALLNPISLKRAIIELSGPVENIQFLKTGNLFVTCETNSQLTTMIKKNAISINSKIIPVKFSLAYDELTTQGKIYAPNLDGTDLGDILAELKDQKVIKIEKLLKDATKAHISLYLITFSGTICPEVVQVAFCRYKVDRYYPAPRRCSKCCRWGHIKSMCKSQAFCAKCGEKGHDLASCTSEITKCPHCSLDHTAFSRSCQRVKDEKEIIKIKCDNKISYANAKALYYTGVNSSSQTNNSLNLSQTSPSYNRNFPQMMSQNQNISQNPSSSQESTIFDSNGTNIPCNQSAWFPPATRQYPDKPSQISQSSTSANYQRNFISQHSLRNYNVSQTNLPVNTQNLNDSPQSQSLSSINSLITLFAPFIPSLIKFLFAQDFTSKIESLKDLSIKLNIESLIEPIIAELNISSIIEQ